MDSNLHVSTFTITMEMRQDLGVKTEFLVASYNSIYARARNAAPQQISNELVISQDGRVKTTFHTKVSSRMAPYLIKAIQDETKPDYGVTLKAYFHKLQEEVMAQMFSGVEPTTFPRFAN